MTREEKLISLYKSCLENNYTDISDETQQLKVKVFAMDLQLRYKDIGALYNEAKELYENAERIKAEEAVVGEKILILTDDEKVKHYIYKRPNGSVYCRRDGDDKKSSFRFEACPKKILNSTYHPSKTIYTGASSGGVSMGGFHQTEAYYTQSASNTNKGEVVLVYQDKKITLSGITVPTEIGKLYKHDKFFESRFVGNKAKCKLSSTKLQRETVSAAMFQSSSYEEKISMASYLSNELYLEFSVCQEFVEFLNRVCKGQLPEQDEDIYIRAKKLAESDKKSDLVTSKELFVKIGDYKDSATLSENLSEKIKEAEKIEEEQAQLEKERLVLKKEAQAKRNKKLALTISPIVAVALVFVIILTTVIIPNNKYNDAVTLMDAGKYEEAITEFEELDGAKDSDDKLKECNYYWGLSLMEKGKSKEAMSKFSKSGDFKDSKELYSSIMKEIAVKETISAGGSHTVGIKSDGTVVAVGKNNVIKHEFSNWTDIVAISAANFHTVGLKSDGTVVAVGSNSDGQCDVEDWTDIVAIFVGPSCTIGLKSDGTVVTVGNNSNLRHGVSDWTDIVAISVGTYHTIGLKSDGTVVAVGDNKYGECDVSDWTDIVAISTGEHHTVGLKSDGTVVAVGNNYRGECEVSDWTDIVAISASDYHTIGLKSDGTVVAVGENYLGECNVFGWSDIVAISTGDYHTVGLKSDGTVVATGEYNVYNWQNIKVPE